MKQPSFARASLVGSWLGLAVAACGSTEASTGTGAIASHPPAPGMTSALASSAPQPSAAVTAPCPDVLSEAEKAHPEDVQPEPQAPPAECRFRPNVRCVPPPATLSARQPPPFAGCPRSILRAGRDIGGVSTDGFSRVETRKRRLAGACGPTPEDGDCCYVDFDYDVCL